MPVEAGLADEDLDPAAERLADAVYLIAQRRQRLVVGPAANGTADPGRRAVLAKAAAQRGGPLAGSYSRFCGSDCCGHDVLALVSGYAR